jgi:hypothetical protein
MTSTKPQKTPKKYECVRCYFITSNKKDYTRHLATDKHIKMGNTYKILTNASQNGVITPNQFCCECGKKYKHRQSLNTHRKKCNFKNENSDKNDKIIVENNENIDYKMLLLKSIEQQNLIISDIIPKLALVMNSSHTTNSNNTNNTNSNNVNNTNNINQKLNLNIYLNETCKDAISLNEFVKNIEVTVSDLLLSKNEGLVKGISNLFLKNLNKLPAIQRPVWCSDKKRKKIFVKEETWTEDIDNNKTKEAIMNISKTQSSNINKYIEHKPNWMTNDKDKTTYIDIVKTVTDEFNESKKDKVIDTIIDTIHLTQDKIV